MRDAPAQTVSLEHTADARDMHDLPSNWAANVLMATSLEADPTQSVAVSCQL